MATEEQARETDTELAELSEQTSQLRSRIRSKLDTLHSATGERKVWRGRRQCWVATDEDAQGAARALIARDMDKNLSRGWGFLARTLDEIGELASEQAKLGERIEQLNEIYRSDPWSRFFPCTAANGHIHSSTACSTCYPTTEFAWRPDLSGKTQADAVAAEGEYLCTVCFPDAPSNWCRDRSEDRKVQAAADRAGREAKRLLKDLREDEQFEGYDGWKVKTVAGAKKALRDEVEMRHFSGIDQHHTWWEASVAAAEAARKVLLARGVEQAEIEKIVTAAGKKMAGIWAPKKEQRTAGDTSQAALPARATYEGHSSPARSFYYFGAGEFNSCEGAPLIESVRAEGSDHVLVAHDGREIRVAAGAEFWIAASPPSAEFWEAYHAAGDSLPDPAAVAAAGREAEAEAGS